MQILYFDHRTDFPCCFISKDYILCKSEVDKSYLGAKRIKAKRGRNVATITTA
ncbi:MAG: hypothetical protein SCARUB_00951 [Candidatus Scalindua rubra]|uniref:Uncharacterized protein n=1 Tax=Candidatus Scalindua rubra TaxID=1872076 RepID=A0A1E3XE69_9BACT|nr:MAG: hypothetical protein SCARUB_00951 [Candidatus Scalindua rubra]